MFNNLDFFTQKYLLYEVLSLHFNHLNPHEIQIIINQYFFNKTQIIQEISLLELENFLNQYSSIHINEQKPLSKIFKNKQFYGLDFYVDENVLCPRQETEILIEFIINLNLNFNSVLDLGTGSGIIAITLKKFLNSSITAIDICDKALNIAKKNAKKHNVNINFVQNNWLENINEKYDILISNPPYLSNEEIIKNKELSFDPYIALFAEDDGFYFYEKIAEKKHLFKYIFLEINYKHINKLENLFPNCVFIKDYNGFNQFLYYKNIL